MTTVKKQNCILHFWDVGCSKVDGIISFLFIKRSVIIYFYNYFSLIIVQTLLVELLG
jgi:hypothetical protein